EVIEDRTLVNAVAAPGPGQTEHGHPPREPAEQGGLLAGQTELRMHRVPTAALRGRRMLVEKGGIGQGCGENARPVHIHIHPAPVPVDLEDSTRSTRERRGYPRPL